MTFDARSAARVAKITRTAEQTPVKKTRHRRRSRGGSTPVGLQLKDFALGIRSYNHAEGTIQINAGQFYHHPNVFDVNAAGVQITGGSENNPMVVYLEYSHRNSAQVIESASADIPPQSSGVTRIWLYKLYFANGKIQHPSYGWINQMLLLGSIAS